MATEVSGEVLDEGGLAGEVILDRRATELVGVPALVAVDANRDLERLADLQVRVLGLRVRVLAAQHPAHVGAAMWQAPLLAGEDEVLH